MTRVTPITVDLPINATPSLVGRWRAATNYNETFFPSKIFDSISAAPEDFICHKNAEFAAIVVGVVVIVTVVDVVVVWNKTVLKMKIISYARWIRQTENFIADINMTDSCVIFFMFVSWTPVHCLKIKKKPWAQWPSWLNAELKPSPTEIVLNNFYLSESSWCDV